MKFIKWGMKTISTPGAYSGVPIDDYHKSGKLLDAPSISSSGMKTFIKRPSEYWAYSVYNKNAVSFKETASLNLGRAAHSLILNDGEFQRKFVFQPEEIDGKPWNGRTAICRQWNADQEDAGLTIISGEQLKTIRGMVEGMKAHPAIANGLLNGFIEKSLFAKFGGIWLRSRPDCILSSGDFVDLKTITDISDVGISKALMNYGYFIQAAIVRMVSREVFGEDFFQSFIFCFVEKTEPFECRVMQLKEGDIDLGERLVMNALPKFENCLNSGQWHGYDGADKEVGWCEIPAWYRTQLNVDIDQEEREAGREPTR